MILLDHHEYIYLNNFYIISRGIVLMKRYTTHAGQGVPILYH